LEKQASERQKALKTVPAAAQIFNQAALVHVFHAFLTLLAMP